MVSCDGVYTIYTAITEEDVSRSLLGDTHDNRDVRIRVAQADGHDLQDIDLRFCQIRRSEKFSGAFHFKAYTTVDDQELVVEGTITKNGGNAGGHGTAIFMM